MSIKTIKIGKQEWATENLKLYDKGLGKDHWVSKLTGETFYSIDAAVRIVSEQAKGFHIPSAEEWDEVAKTCGCILIPTEVSEFNAIRELREYKKVDKLKELLNINNFNGFYQSDDKSFNYVGDCSYFWMPSARNVCYLKAIDENTLSGKYGRRTLGLSIRLVKDA